MPDPMLPPPDQQEPRALTMSNVMKEIQTLKDKFKSEDDEQLSPYQDLEKATVLQECRVFHDANVVTQNPRLCCQLITKLLHIITQGDQLTSAETTDVFFGVTKLFQSNHANLRRMMYLFIKEVAETCNPDDVIIVTSSLTKDMNSREDLYKANAIRVLSKIIDSTMLGAIERYMKQAIVDKNPLVSSSALVAGMHLMGKSPEIVRRWVNEVQEAVNSQNEMVQFHALSLLYDIKQKDRLAVSKLVSQLTRGTLRSPMAICLLIRYISTLLADDPSSQNARSAYQFLESSLRHKNEMVIYEAAKAICNLPGVEARDLGPAITVLQLFLSSPKPTFRFCAMRTLSEVALKYPVCVTKCNEDMETLISDANRSIGTLAITTLLKTGDEGSVDRLMKQISTFMNDIADEFKVLIVTSIKQLCLKFPQKQAVLVGFLANFLREEGGFEYKKAITDSIVELMNAIPDTKETSLFHLCEFIEDCEFTELSTQILHLIGQVGPTTAHPARYIRFIYNRVILENNVVRAAAVSTLAKFAVRVPSLRPSVLVLLRRSLKDDDDEVRDRVTLALSALESEEAGPLLLEPLPMAFSALERSLKAYVQHQAATGGRPLTFSSLPIVEEAPGIPDSGLGVGASPGGASLGASASGAITSPSASPTPEQEDPLAGLYAIPQVAKLGRVFRSAFPVALTESETEYVVSVTKHIFESAVVLQFNVTNTIPEQRLLNVRVQLENVPADLYKVTAVVPLPKLACGSPGSTYVLLQRELGAPITHESMECQLHFNVVDVDPVSGEVEGDPSGFPEEYALEPLEIGAADYMAKVSLGDFKRNWETLGPENEVLEKFQLQFKQLNEAIVAVIDFLGMQPCDGTAAVGKAGATTHNLHLSGVFVGNKQVLVRAQLQLDQQAGMVLKIAVRSEDLELSQMVADCIK